MLKDDLFSRKRKELTLIEFQGCTKKRLRNILLCISEAVTNVIKHADHGIMKVRQIDNRSRRDLREVVKIMPLRIEKWDSSLAGGALPKVSYSGIQIRLK